MTKSGKAIISRRQANHAALGALALGMAAPAHAQSKTGKSLKVSRVLIEWQEAPQGLDTFRPRFQWTLTAASPKARGLSASAFRLRVFADQAMTTTIFDTGQVKSALMRFHPDSDLPFKSQTRYHYRLEVWDQDGRPCPPHQGAFATGLMLPEDNQARWLAAGPDVKEYVRGLEGRKPGLDSPLPLPMFRRALTLEQKPVTALLAVRGLGQYQVYLNDQQISPQGLNGGWSHYDRRVAYDTYDITQVLTAGKHQLGLAIGNGFFNVEGIKGRYTKLIGSFGQPQMWLQLKLIYADGHEETIISNEQWQTRTGDTTYSSIFGGEDFQAAPDSPLLADHADWRPATVIKGPSGVLEAGTFAAMTVQKRLKVVKVTTPKPGVLMFDFGLNHSGRPDIRLKKTTAGQKISLYPSEVLRDDGTIYQRSMGADDKTIAFHYTCRGDAEESWQPQFTYTGYRYLQVEGARRDQIAAIDSLFMYDDLEINGNFQCSDKRLEAIHGLIRQALLSNLASVITDCPHREKLGWLEQIYLNAPTALMNVDAVRLYEKMCADMRDAQLPNGMVTAIVPEFVKFVDGNGNNTAFRDSPEWGAAMTYAPWAIYRLYGDQGILQQNYPAMTARMAYMETRLQPDGLLNYGLGDWYDIGPKPPGVAQLTTKRMTGTATFYGELTVMAQIAHILGHDDAAERYKARAAALKTTIQARLFDPVTARFDTGSQAAQAMALVLGLVPETHHQQALEVLVADIRSRNDHVTAGDIGFHYVVRALSDNNRSDVLYAMLSREDKPSYGQQLKAGATALTEAWDSWRESSQNHFMLGHAEIWFYQGLGGLQIDHSRARDPIVLAPQPVSGVEFCDVRYGSVFGLIRCRLSRRNKTWRLQAEIPVGATALIKMPCQSLDNLREGGRVVTPGEGIVSVDSELGQAHIRVGSGLFNFTATAV